MLSAALPDRDARLIGRRSSDKPPLSFAQERLWFLDQLGLTGAAYNIAVARMLEGPLHNAALEQALGELVRRHEPLRTRFEMFGSGPIQVIDPPRPVQLERTDLTGLGPATQRMHTEQLQAAEAARPFDLRRGPLFRCTLVRLAAMEHLLLITMHHIITDGWSVNILLRELWTLYGAFRAGRPSPLAEPHLQYADFAKWQRESDAGAGWDEHLAYWRGELAGAPEALEFPTDRPRPTIASYGNAVHPLRLSAELSEALTTLSVREGATLFMTLLAGFQAVLAHWCGTTDVVVGVSIAGRTHRQTQDMVGCFVNMLPLRARVSPWRSFRDLVRAVRRSAVAAYAHQDAPFERLVAELAPERHLSRHPLFQADFTFHNQPGARRGEPAPQRRGGAALWIRPLGDAGNRDARLDLSLELLQTPSGVAGRLAYATDLFDAETIARLAKRFARLLSAAVADPDRPLTDLDILDPDERIRLLDAGAGPVEVSAASGRLEALIAVQAKATPDAMAVISGDACLSYASLERQANQLAWRLAALGIGSETVVGVCLERKPALMVALLAILKAGGAYLPLDPGYPAERLTYMAVDAKVAMVVTTSNLQNRLGEGVRSLLLLDQDEAAIAAQPQTAPIPGASVQNLAYVIYTSGSTGRPKGVGVTHAALVNFLASLSNIVALDSDDVVLATTALSFDIAALELWAPLIVGARVCLVDSATILDPPALNAVLRSSLPTLIQATPTAWRQWLTSDVRPPAGLKILCGGEVMPVSLSRILAGAGRTWNLYGPTETTVWSTCTEISVADARPPIGRPIANTQIYVLDEMLQLRPVGASGEIWIAGEGLARGYLNRPGLTADRFIACPFGPPGSRMYRTGDLGRWRSDGQLEHLGRTDHQIKLRGHRIELGEIEAALGAHADVTEAAAVMREHAPGEARLVAYVTLRAGASAGPAELRAHLARSLPEPMIPSTLAVLEAMPLTPNRKIDRAALPTPRAPSSGHALVAPRTATEQSLAAIWAEVLGLDQVGVDDNFFDLGGHSLLAARVVHRARAELGWDLTLRNLFEHPSVEQLTAAADPRNATTESGDYVEGEL